MYNRQIKTYYDKLSEYTNYSILRWHTTLTVSPFVRLRWHTPLTVSQLSVLSGKETATRTFYIYQYQISSKYAYLWVQSCNDILEIFNFVLCNAQFGAVICKTNRCPYMVRLMAWLIFTYWLNFFLLKMSKSKVKTKQLWKWKITRICEFAIPV